MKITTPRGWMKSDISQRNFIAWHRKDFKYTVTITIALKKNAKNLVSIKNPKTGKYFARRKEFETPKKAINYAQNWMRNHSRGKK